MEAEEWGQRAGGEAVAFTESHLPSLLSAAQLPLAHQAPLQTSHPNIQLERQQYSCPNLLFYK